jgi:hypothetical protein
MTEQARTQQDYPAVVADAYAKGAAECPTCLGDGRVAGGTDTRDPWPVWAALPPGSDLAVRIGIVYPVPCPTCDGTGHAP